MNNKGFAITGIIYTLFILFLMILLTVLTGLSSYQRLMINSTSSLESSFEGEKLNSSVNSEEFLEIKDNGDAKYLGKYVFKIDVNGDGIINGDDKINGDIVNTECSAYLKKDIIFSGYTAEDFLNSEIKLSPQICNESFSSYKLVLDRVYSFEGVN